MRLQKSLWHPIVITSLLLKHFDCFDTSALTLKNEKNKERKELKKKHQTKSN
jgi:hypothetical protein